MHIHTFLTSKGFASFNSVGNPVTTYEKRSQLVAFGGWMRITIVDDIAEIQGPGISDIVFVKDIPGIVNNYWKT